MKTKNGLFSRIWDMPYGKTNVFQLFDAAKNSKDFVQKLRLVRKIPVHHGCVNSICWNENGKYLLSGADDQRLSIVHGYDYSVLANIQTGHRANIFSAKFLPNTNDTHVVSCSGDGIIIYSDIEWPETSLNNKFTCHIGTAYEIMTVPNDPNTFLSCGEDRSVRWFDLRTKTSCSKEECKEDVLINCRAPVTSLAVNPVTPYQLAVGCGDSTVRIFDRRMLGTPATGNFSSNGFQALMTCFSVPEFKQSRRITSLCYSADGEEMLVSYSSDYIYLFDIRDDLGKKPRILSHDATPTNTENDIEMPFHGRPLMKRLRVRGDWSDTGPDARPEAESRGEQQTSSTQANLVRRMTDILTRMLNSPARNRNRSSASQSSSASSHISSQSEDGEMEGVSDSNEEERDENANAETKKKNESHTKSETSNNTSDTLSKETSETKSDKNNPSLPSASSSAFKSQNTDSYNQIQPNNLPKTNDSKVNSSAFSENQDPQSEAINLSFDNIEKELASRRNELVEKHHTEPMVNMHYSGQSVSSGLITMDVASSSTANERQWLEQTESTFSNPDIIVQSTEDLTPQNKQTDTIESAHQSSSSNQESETETAIQTIEPNNSVSEIVETALIEALDVTPSIVVPEASGEHSEGEVALMMEVDSWDIDSDEAPSPERSPEPSPSGATRRTSCDRLPDSFFCSLDEDAMRAEDMKKEEAHMANVTKPRVKQKYTGHRNARTMIKESTFWGTNFIMSGSDCGHIFIWDRHTAELVMIMEADHHVVNCLQPHPFDPILASSGIDYDIKLWAPAREEPFFNVEKANEMITRNKIMLEETKDTITVPASFMFRMLATLNHYRSGHSYSWSRAARQMRQSNTDSNPR